MLRKTLAWWRSLPRQSIEGGWAVLLGFGFWATIIILLIISTAAASARHDAFADFFTAFGAIGQVVFAFMVWRLGKQQFAFTQRVAKRQARIDTYVPRKELLARFRQLRSKLHKVETREEGAWELSILRDDIAHICEPATLAAFATLVELTWKIQEKDEEIEEADEMHERERGDELRRARIQLNRQMRLYENTGLRALDDELRIGPE